MTGSLRDDAERVYGYLVEYITAKKYPPSRAEIAQAMRMSKDKLRTRQHSGRGTFLPSDEIQIDAALEALQQAGKIQLRQPASGRLNITLTAMAGQRTTSVAIAPANTAPRRLTPGPIPCIECANPVCEQSKSRCALHWRLQREANYRFYVRKRLAVGKTVQKGKGWQNRRTPGKRAVKE